MPHQHLKLHKSLASYWPVLVPRGIQNPYITDGYRARLQSKLCLKSIFILSNETVNIWSHLLGFLLFFLLGVNDMSTVLPASGANKEDCHLLCVCMLCSVGYHLFSCHLSEKRSCHWLALDYVGTLAVTFQGSCMPSTFWRQVYLVIVIALILAVFLAQIHPHYHSEWRHQRTAIFGSVAGYGVIPAAHWVWLNGSFSSAVVQMSHQIPNIVIEVTLYLKAGAEFLFYIAKIPARYFPGQLNYLGASHQVWHVLVVFMLCWWHQTSVYLMNFRHNQPCPLIYTSSG
uniref:Progestin and adipoQ receptor family member IIIb n=1 Tax=Salmo trutta TaxID=8032 RepID=A0A673Y4U2_SALTR